VGHDDPPQRTRQVTGGENAKGLYLAQPFLAALGGALEFYDFIIFVFFAAVVGELFFPADIPEPSAEC
jgi:hypothetical protein